MYNVFTEFCLGESGEISRCLFVCLVSSTDPPHAGSNYFGVPPQLHMYVCIPLYISRILAGLAIALAVLGGCITFASVPLLSMSNI